MTNSRDILASIENHKGRKLDLNNPKDRTRFFSAIDSEIKERQEKLDNINSIISGGYDVFNTNEQKTIALSDKERR